MQPPRSQATIDRFFTKPQSQQLLPPHNPMLPASQRRDRPVISASPRQPFFKTG
jgi:hypothetical protein